MYLNRRGGEAPRLELSREGVALTPAQRRVVADVLRAANTVDGLWVRTHANHINIARQEAAAPLQLRRRTSPQMWNAYRRTATSGRDAADL
jgi:hypothetical protein